MSRRFRRTLFYLSAIGTTVGGTIILKDYVGGPKYEGEEKIKDKVVIITGATSGIGKATAEALAKREAKVIMASRDMEKCEEIRKDIVINTHNKYVYCRKCDLASQESIRKFVETFKKEQSQLHILINNAGVMRCPRTLTKEGIELQLGVNYMGHFLLTNLLLDTIKASAPSRIINLAASALGSGKIRIDDLNFVNDYEATEAYTQSKLAVMLFTKELSKQLQGTGVTVNAVNPGIVDTKITRHLRVMNNIAYKVFVYPFMWIMSKSPKSGAQSVLHAALDPNLNDVSGAYLQEMKNVPAPEVVNNQVLLRWLWLVSEKWTNPQKIVETNPQTNVQPNLNTNVQNNEQTKVQANIDKSLQKSVPTSLQTNIQTNVQGA